MLLIFACIRTRSIYQFHRTGLSLFLPRHDWSAHNSLFDVAQVLIAGLTQVVLFWHKKLKFRKQSILYFQMHTDSPCFCKRGQSYRPVGCVQPHLAEEAFNEAASNQICDDGNSIRRVTKKILEWSRMKPL